MGHIHGCDMLGALSACHHCVHIVFIIHSTDNFLDHWFKDCLSLVKSNYVLLCSHSLFHVAKSFVCVCAVCVAGA